MELAVCISWGWGLCGSLLPRTWQPECWGAHGLPMCFMRHYSCHVLLAKLISAVPVTTLTRGLQNACRGQDPERKPLPASAPLSPSLEAQGLVVVGLDCN